MKYTPCLLAVFYLLTACNVVDPGPTLTGTNNIDVGNAETVRARISMGAGSLEIAGGASNLMSASFRYSEHVGLPVVHYDSTGNQGQLTVESPKNSSAGGKTVNEWGIRLNSDIPLDMEVSMGAGEGKLDMSRLKLRSLKVDMGAGEVDLNVGGRYSRDVTVEVNGGVGEAKIKLPKNMGAEVEATGGLGSVSWKGMAKRDGKYYNDAYVEGQPAVHMQVHGGIGNIDLSVAE